MTTKRVTRKNSTPRHTKRGSNAGRKTKAQEGENDGMDSIKRILYISIICIIAGAAIAIISFITNNWLLR